MDCVWICTIFMLVTVELLKSAMYILAVDPTIRVCVCVCVRACVRACVRVCV